MCRKDLTTAAAKNAKFKFDYYLLISKTYKDALSPDVQQGGKKKGGGTKIAESDQLMFANAEDEYFYKVSMSIVIQSVSGQEGKPTPHAAGQLEEEERDQDCRKRLTHVCQC